MQHDPNIVNIDGSTYAMQYIGYRKKDPPKWAWHDPNIQNNYHGETCAMIYIICCEKNPPEWMIDGEKNPPGWMID